MIGSNWIEFNLILRLKIKRYPKKEVYQADEIYDYFNDECDMDEILGDVVGYSRLCKRILGWCKQTNKNKNK